jgi:hypothetical protein
VRFSLLFRQNLDKFSLIRAVCGPRMEKLCHGHWS